MRHTCALLAVLLCLSGTAHGDAQSSISVREAVSLALARNHLLKSGEHLRAASALAVEAAKSGYLPRITLEESFSASSAPGRAFMMKLDQGRITAGDFSPSRMNDPATTRDFRTTISIEQPIYDPAVSRGIAVAEAADAAESWQLARLREETAFQTLVAYLRVQRAGHQLSVADRAVAAAGEHQRLARARSAAGTGLRADELRAGAFLSEMLQQQITARHALDLARLELARQVGDPPGTMRDIATPLTASPLPATGNALIEMALTSRQDLQAQERTLARAAGEVRLAEAALMPTLYGAATYQMNDGKTPFGRDNDGWFAGATVRWELFDGFRRSHLAARADSQQRARAQEVEGYRNAVALQVTESTMGYEEAEKRLAAARESVQAGEEGVRLVQRRYENSLSLFIELIDAQMSLNRSRANLAEQESALIQAAARVRHAAGIFLKEAQ